MTLQHLLYLFLSTVRSTAPFSFVPSAFASFAYNIMRSRLLTGYSLVRISTQHRNKQLQLQEVFQLGWLYHSSVLKIDFLQERMEICYLACYIANEVDTWVTFSCCDKTRCNSRRCKRRGSQRGPESV